MEKVYAWNCIYYKASLSLQKHSNLHDMPILCMDMLCYKGVTIKFGRGSLKIMMRFATSPLCGTHKFF